MFNRNKKSLVLDLHTPEGKEAVLKLIATADVVSENFKPETMQKLGLDYESLKALNPRLIYVSHKGFLPGPYDHRTALDEVVQMMGGLAYMTGRSGDPLRAGSSVNDIMGGLFGAIGVMAALKQREATGAGPEGGERAVREQRVSGGAAHDAVRHDRRARQPHARAHFPLGHLRRVPGQRRRADLPGGGERHPMGHLLPGLRACRFQGR